MKINLEILKSHYVYDPEQIEYLNTKVLVPKMLTRRRLTRSAKIAIYLASQVEATHQRIIYGTMYGELLSTQKILNSIKDQEQISPTVFQNSVYNTAVSYLSILNNNKNEIMTISSGHKTVYDILKVGAIKALDGDEILLMYIETINIEHIEKLNNCMEFLEVGVALKVKLTQQEATIKNKNILDVAKLCDNKTYNVLEVNI